MFRDSPRHIELDFTVDPLALWLALAVQKSHEHALPDMGKGNATPRILADAYGWMLIVLNWRRVQDQTST